jgi:hypothetical protein
VSAIFASVNTKQILTTENMWTAILTGPRKKNFYEVSERAQRSGRNGALRREPCQSPACRGRERSPSAAARRPPEPPLRPARPHWLPCARSHTVPPPPLTPRPPR